MRRAVVHIGMPRSGSTTIQHILARLRPALEGVGVLYPDLTPASAADHPHISHQHLGEALDGRRPRGEKTELLRALSEALARTRADTVILSYEDWMREKRAAGIAGLLREVLARGGFRMEAVVTLKPQGEYLNSLYALRTQMIREPRLFAPFAAAFERSARVDYARLLEPWLAACDGRVRAAPLRDRRDPSSFVARVFAECGLGDRLLPLLDGADLGRRENRSPGPVAVEVSRRLRRMRAPDRLAALPRQMMRFVEAEADRRGLDQTPFKGLTPAIRSRLEEVHAGANAAFARRVWGAPWGAVVAAEAEVPPNEIGGGPVAPELEQVIASLVQEACAAFEVAPGRRWDAAPRDLAEQARDAVARALRLSRWRVI